ncbi:MAG: type III PLP-dependent enzyme [Cycloclasticus sp.]|nr:type III PLP-dependent enzyme [Cycloclasticus sp.]
MNRIQVEQANKAQFYKDTVQQHGSPLLLLDCNKIIDQFNVLSDALPNVDFFYAIKALPHPAVIKTLASLGAGFDIASSGEIDLLSSVTTAERPRTIHTHPIKRNSDIRDALRFGCTTFIIDNIWELEKFIAYRHRVGILIRVSFPNPNTKIDLSRKFGCREDEVGLLIHKAQSLGIHIKGLSFHAGSQCPTSQNHVLAINRCIAIINAVYADCGKILSILDIGGGFPVQYTESVQTIEEFCSPIRDALKNLPPHIQLIAEPGRFLSAPAMEAISTVMGKAKRGNTMWYYLDDGVYGSYSGQIFDHVTYPLTTFGDKKKTAHAVIAGPTCDSIDVIADEIKLPPLSIGDLVIGHQMGAYTYATATHFNLFSKAKIIAINESVNTTNNILAFKNRKSLIS